MVNFTDPMYFMFMFMFVVYIYCRDLLAQTTHRINTLLELAHNECNIYYYINFDIR